MFDVDTCNAINAEERQYNKWEREEKNRILRLHNYDKKVALWHKMFGTHQESDDSWLEEAKVF